MEATIKELPTEPMFKFCDLSEEKLDQLDELGDEITENSPLEVGDLLYYKESGSMDGCNPWIDVRFFRIINITKKTVVIQQIQYGKTYTWRLRKYTKENNDQRYTYLKSEDLWFRRYIKADLLRTLM